MSQLNFHKNGVSVFVSDSDHVTVSVHTERNESPAEARFFAGNDKTSPFWSLDFATSEGTIVHVFLSEEGFEQLRALVRDQP